MNICTKDCFLHISYPTLTSHLNIYMLRMIRWCMAFCSNCGNEVSGRFCSNCGTQSGYSGKMESNQSSYSQNRNMGGTNTRKSWAMNPGSQGLHFYPHDITDINVINQYKGLSEEEQNSFMLAYTSQKRSIGIAYLFFLFLPGTHYIYLSTVELGKGIALSLLCLFILFWVVRTIGLFLFIVGFFIWWFIELIRMSWMVRNKNNKIAMRILLNMATMSS